MEALHRYLLARHHIDNYDDYMQLLAMFRNTAAIEGLKGRTRYEEIQRVFAQTSTIRDILLDNIKSRHTL